MGLFSPTEAPKRGRKPIEDDPEIVEVLHNSYDSGEWQGANVKTEEASGLRRELQRAAKHLGYGLSLDISAPGADGSVSVSFLARSIKNRS